MKMLPDTLVLRWPGTPEGRGHGKRKEQEAGAANRKPALIERMREQVCELERAIAATEAMRDGITESAVATTSALLRFECALANLRLTLENQQSARQRIETARQAGEAAALVRAQLLAGEFAVDRLVTEVSSTSRFES